MLLDIYARISKDREGAGLGVDRQELDCRQHLERLGHQVGVIHADNDLTAYRRKRRPGYEDLLERLKGGESQGLIVWHLDRLTRHPREIEDVIDLVEATGALVLTVTGGDYDLSTTDGRAMARVVCAFARKESEDKARRNARKHLEVAQAGRPVGGTRHFGYDPLYVDGQAVLVDPGGHPTLRVRPDEAVLIREASAAILAGESMRSIVRRWNDQGVQLSRGGQRVTAGALRRILTSPTIAGWRALHGEPIAEATWEPIVDVDLQQRVRAVIDHRATTYGGFRAGPRTYLLTGLARCGRCGAALVTMAHRGHRTYHCPTDPSKAGCGRLRVTAARLEGEVRARVVHVIDERLLAEHQAPPDDVQPLLAQLAQLEAQERELAQDYYADRAIDRRQFFAATQALGDRMAELRRAIAEHATTEAVLPTLGDVEGILAGDDLGRARAILDRLIERIVVKPATTRAGFDPNRVEVLWRA